MFIVVDNPETRDRLVRASFGQTQVRDASHLVVFAAKTDFAVADVESHIAHTAEFRDLPIDSLTPFRDMLVGRDYRKHGCGYQTELGSTTGYDRPQESPHLRSGSWN
jgi:hypothetical protein